MNKYKIYWSRNDYGEAIVEAKTEDEAIDKFYKGEYDPKDFEIKGGEIESDEVELITK